MRLIASEWLLLLCVLLMKHSVEPLTPLEAKSMSAKVVISSGVEFRSSATSDRNYRNAGMPDVSSVLATLTSYPRESFHQEVRNIDVTGNPQPDAVTRDEFDNLQLYWTKPSSNLCDFQLQANVQTKAKIVPVKQKIRFPISEDILPPEVVNDFLQITEIANQNREIQEIAHTISRNVKDPADLYHVVFAIAEWVKTSIKYDTEAMKNPQKNTVCRSAVETLASGIGKCDELSALFVSLNRALGIPSRFVTGYAYTNIPLGENGDDPKNWGGHAWAEVYFPSIGWVPFDVAYGEYGYLSAGHVMLSTSDDAADNTNVHYHAQGFDFTITPRIIDITVEPTDVTKDQWSEWSTSSSSASAASSPAQDVNVSLEAPEGSQQAGIGEVIRLVCTLQNPYDCYVCTRLDIANTQDTTLLDEMSDHVLLNPQETKQIPLSFEVDPNLQKGYAYEFPFSVASGAQEARTTIMVKDQQDLRQHQVQGMKMQWENPARTPYYDDPRGPPPPGRGSEEGYWRDGYGGMRNDGRGSGSTGNSAGDWWGEGGGGGGGGRSMFQSSQPRQPTPEDWKRAEQGYQGGDGRNDGRGGAQYEFDRYQNNRGDDRRYQTNDGGGGYQSTDPHRTTLTDDRGYQGNERGYQDPYQQQQQQQKGRQDDYYRNDKYYDQPSSRPATAPYNSQGNDWYENAGKTIMDQNNGWWNKEKREGSKVRDYDSAHKGGEKKEDTSWSMGYQGRIDDTRRNRGAAYQPNTRGYDSSGRKNRDSNTSSTREDSNQSRFQNSNRYDDSFYSKGASNASGANNDQGYQDYGQQRQQQQQQQQRQSPQDGGWNGSQPKRAGEWQRNDLLGRSREKYFREQMMSSPLRQPPPPFGPYDGPYGPPPPPPMDSNQGNYYPRDNYRGDNYRGDNYRNQERSDELPRQDYRTREGYDAGRRGSSSYSANVDSTAWWDDK